MDRVKIGMGLTLLVALTGCVGYVDGGYGAAVVVPGPPDVFFYGGPYYEGRRDARAYSRRGVESRTAAHPAPRGPAGRR